MSNFAIITTPTPLDFVIAGNVITMGGALTFLSSKAVLWLGKTIVGLSDRVENSWGQLAVKISGYTLKTLACLAGILSSIAIGGGMIIAGSVLAPAASLAVTALGLTVTASLFYSIYLDANK